MPVQSVSMTTPSSQNAQLRAIEQRRQLGQVLQNQSLQPLDRGRMVGRVYAPTTPMEGVAKLGQALAGAFKIHQADANEKQFVEDKNKRLGLAMEEAMKLKTGTPAVPGMPETGDTNEIWTGKGTTHKPATPGTPAVPGNEQASYIRMAQEPEYRAAFMGKLFPAEKAPIKIGKNEKLLDPVTKQELASNMVPDKTTMSAVKKLQTDRAALVPNSPTYDRDLKEINASILKTTTHKPGTKVNVDNRSIEESEFEKKVGKVEAERYLEWRSDKGTQAVRNLADLASAYDDLVKNPEISGALQGAVPDFLLPFTNPKLLAVKEKVASVVQQNLKAILGGQFSEKEGERLIERAFNPSLGARENMRRVGNLLQQMRLAKAARDDMANYVEQRHSMKGYKGKRFYESDFTADKIFGKDDIPFNQASANNDGWADL